MNIAPDLHIFGPPTTNTYEISLPQDNYIFPVIWWDNLRFQKLNGSEPYFEHFFNIQE